MAQYTVLLIGLTAAVDATDVQTQEYNAKWVAWMGDLAARDVLRGGAPFTDAGKVVTKQDTTDLVVNPVDVGGFLVIEAESFEAAAAIVQSSPSVQIGGSAIIRECIPVG
jgi:uncharacterized Zn-binding protein involved in type VI secretion